MTSELRSTAALLVLMQTTLDLSSAEEQQVRPPAGVCRLIRRGTSLRLGLMGRIGMRVGVMGGLLVSYISLFTCWRWTDMVVASTSYRRTFVRPL